MNPGRNAHAARCRSERRRCYGCYCDIRLWFCDARGCASPPTGIRPFQNYSGNISAICADCMDDYRQCGRHGRRAIPAAVRREVMQRDGRVCQLCWEPVTGALHLDHIRPYVEGGPDTVENLRVTCAPCNLGRPKPKRTRPVECESTRHWRLSLALAGKQIRSAQSSPDCGAA